MLIFIITLINQLNQSTAFTKISLTHNGKELRADPLIVNDEFMLEELFRVFGLRNDNDNGSLVQRSNYGKADVVGVRNCMDY